MSREPLTSASPSVESSAARHNRIYTALLIALAIFCALGMISIYSFSRGPTFPPESHWMFQMILGIYGVLIAAMMGTLVLRSVAPRAGRIATMALNVVLLFVFPIGTPLGIYGLMKVDKGDPLAGP